MVSFSKLSLLSLMFPEQVLMDCSKTPLQNTANFDAFVSPMPTISCPSSMLVVANIELIFVVEISRLCSLLNTVYGCIYTIQECKAQYGGFTQQCTIFWCLESDHCTKRSHPNWCWCSNNTEVSCEGLKCGHSQRCCCRSELKHFSTISYCDIDGIENDDAILLCRWRWVPCYSGWTRAAGYSYKILWVRVQHCGLLPVDRMVILEVPGCWTTVMRRQGGRNKLHWPLTSNDVYPQWCMAINRNILFTLLHFRPDDDWRIQSKCRQVIFRSQSW